MKLIRVRRVWLLMGVFACLVSAGNSDSLVVLFAFEADIKTLRAEAKELAEPKPWFGGKLYNLQIGGHTVRAALMQSGCIESAVTASALLARERPDWLISVGVAGSLSDANPRGAWLAVNELALNDTIQPTGAKPFMKLNILPDYPALSVALPAAWREAREVRLFSAGRFLHDSAERAAIKSESGAEVVDMNLLGIVRACQRAGVKNLHWRIVSDWADEKAGADFRSFVSQYNGAGGRAVAEFLGKLPVSPERPEAYPQLNKMIQSMNTQMP